MDLSVARFALFVLFARATLSDAARADGAPTLDVDDVGQGYVEVRTTGKRVKTRRRKRRRLKLLQTVAPAQGLTDRSWAVYWLQARRDCGQDVEEGAAEETGDGGYQSGDPDPCYSPMTFVASIE